MAYSTEESRKITSLDLIVFIVLTIGVLLPMPDYILAQRGLSLDPKQTPIDGGLEILVALSGTYTIKNCEIENRFFDLSYFLYFQ